MVLFCETSVESREKVKRDVSGQMVAPTSNKKIDSSGSWSHIGIMSRGRGGSNLSSLAEVVGTIEGPGPLYRRLQDALRMAIETSILNPQDALPPERDLATDFAVSRITVRKALDALVAEGLLIRKQGAGTFVSGRVEKQFAKLTSFSEDMASRGRTPRSEWLLRASGSVTPEESLTLGLSPGAPVYRLRNTRLRTFTGKKNGYRG